MHANDLYNQVKVKWPTSIGISDGFPQGNGHMFPTLCNIYHEIEDRIDYTTEHWESVGQWAFFQAARKLAIHSISEGLTEINLNNVSLLVFDSYVQKNLDLEGWEIERQQYKSGL